MSKSKILFMLSGSIAAFKACQLISRLVQLGHEVRVVATKSAFQFIGPATLEGLTGTPALSDLWEGGRAMDHIHLTRWADFAILCPASANTLARIATGLADDLVGAMTLAWPEGKPFWLVPAMNQQMLKAAVTQENLTKLKTRGFSLAPTQNGALACGEEGLGRMLEVEDILQLITPKKLGSVLITGGATREPIDAIRFLSNVSTGQTAARLSELLENRGWNVTYLHGQSAAQPAVACRTIAFHDFTSLDDQLRCELSTHDHAAVIHCAAVSDFSPVNPQPDVKLSSAQALTLKLKPNFKILPRLKEYSRNKDIRVVGFKLTVDGDAKKAAREILSPTVDAIVANAWNAVQADRSKHPGTLITRQRQEQDFADLAALTSHLHNLFIEKPGELHDSLP